MHDGVCYDIGKPMKNSEPNIWFNTIFPFFFKRGSLQGNRPSKVTPMSKDLFCVGVLSEVGNLFESTQEVKYLNTVDSQDKRRD